MTERHIGIESELRIKNDMTGEQNVPRNVEYSLNEQGLLQSIGYDGGSRAYSHKGSMLNPTGHQTLEFRGGVGTNDIKDILAWIDFLNNVVKTSNRESVDGVKFGDLLKGETISEYVKGLKGWRKLSKSDLKKTINANKLT